MVSPAPGSSSLVRTPWGHTCRLVSCAAATGREHCSWRARHVYTLLSSGATSGSVSSESATPLAERDSRAREPEAPSGTPPTSQLTRDGRPASTCNGRGVCAPVDGAISVPSAKRKNYPYELGLRKPQHSYRTSHAATPSARGGFAANGNWRLKAVIVPPRR